MKSWILNNMELILTSIVTPFLTWFFTKRHFKNQERKKRELENSSTHSNLVSQNLALYQKIIDDYTERTERELKTAYDKIEELRSLLEACRVNVIKIEEENYNLRLEIEELKHN